MLKNNDSSSNVIENNDFINPIALNFAAIVGNLFLFHWLFKISRFLLILGSFDCGPSCLPNWTHFDYPIDNVILEYYLVITIYSLIIFVLLFFVPPKLAIRIKIKRLLFLNYYY